MPQVLPLRTATYRLQVSELLDLEVAHQVDSAEGLAVLDCKATPGAVDLDRLHVDSKAERTRTLPEMRGQDLRGGTTCHPTRVMTMASEHLEEGRRRH